MRAFRSVGLLLILTLVAAVLADDAIDPGDFKMLGAKNAAETYNGALTKLTREYKEHCNAARKACIAQLASAQQAATKAGNLDEAVKIRDTIARLNSEVQETPAAGGSDHDSGFLATRQKLTKALGNTSWQVGDARIRFNDDGTGVFLDAGGKNPDPAKNAWAWAVVTAHEVVIRYSSGWTNRLEFDDLAKNYAMKDPANGKKLDLPGGKRIQ